MDIQNGNRQVTAGNARARACASTAFKGIRAASALQTFYPASVCGRYRDARLDQRKEV